MKKEKKKYLELEKPITLAIVGPHYSGKSTLCKMMQRKFGFAVIYEKWWDDPFMNDNPKDYFRSEIWYLLQTSSKLIKAKKLNKLGKNVVLDTFIYSTLIFASTKLRGKDLKVFKEILDFIYTILPKPDLLIYLYASPQYLFNVRRIKRVKEGTGPKGEINTPYSWFKKVCSLNNKFFSNWKTTKLIKINVENLDLLTTDGLNWLSSEIKKIKQIKQY